MSDSGQQPAPQEAPSSARKWGRRAAPLILGLGLWLALEASGVGEVDATLRHTVEGFQGARELRVSVRDAQGGRVAHAFYRLTPGSAAEQGVSLPPGDYTLEATVDTDDGRKTPMQSVSITRDGTYEIRWSPQPPTP